MFWGAIEVSFWRTLMHWKVIIIVLYSHLIFKCQLPANKALQVDSKQPSALFLNVTVSIMEELYRDDQIYYNWFYNNVSAFFITVNSIDYVSSIYAMKIDFHVCDRQRRLTNHTHICFPRALDPPKCRPRHKKTTAKSRSTWM